MLLLYTRLLRILKYPNKVPKKCNAIFFSKNKLEKNICDCKNKCKFNTLNIYPFRLNEYKKNVYTIEYLI
tara:strand:+ start:127 stop:336 length:210 start_codon:yes stop_codon:yes gene_type:complete